MSSYKEDFANPGAEFRGAPFWAWNGKLDPETCRRQIRMMHSSGLGGFFMHSRTGLNTPYLSDEWFKCVDACVDEAKKLKMRAWLYDEDRWPSGAAGGLVTKDERFRTRKLFFFVCKDGIIPADFAPSSATEKITAAFLKEQKAVAAFTAKISGAAASDVRRVPAGKDPAPAPGEYVIFCRIYTDATSSWYNGATYLDTLNPAATAKFIQVTHEAYAKRLGKDLGGVVPGIFTDEPNHQQIIFAWQPDESGVMTRHALAWTDKLPAAFRKLTGYDILPRLVEIICDVDGCDSRRLKYDFTNCLTDLFVKGFVKQIGDWCGAHNCSFTGHMLQEDSLGDQTNTVGSCMRCYEYMQAPGMDMLTEKWRIFQTAKQLSSAAHQFGKKWRVSETYGTTGWDFSFAGHKALGDWQAALGVNVRCQHLAWYTMKGQAKRDYPAAIFYQSPWWNHYGMIEDYFARVNAVMTRGEEVRDLLIIHPVESVWTLTSPNWRHDSRLAKIEDDFIHATDQFLAAHLDFDYGDEDILARHGKVKDGLLTVARGSYRAVVVPTAFTLRSSTLKLLDQFRKAGGLVVFIGDIPELVDAVPSDAARKLAAKCRIAGGDEATALVAGAARRVSIACTATGREFSPALYLLREDDDNRYLFICNTGETFYKPGVSVRIGNHGVREFDHMVRDRREGCDDVTVRVYGAVAGEVQELDAVSGKIMPACASVAQGECVVRTTLPPLASRIFVLPKKGAKPKAVTAKLPELPRRRIVSEKALKGPFDLRLSEANVLVLDHPRYRIGNGAWEPELEILQLDQKVRDALGIQHRGGHMFQPWTIPVKTDPKRLCVELEYEFDVAEVPSGDLALAVEEPSAFRIWVNGQEVSMFDDCGWWTDTSLRKIRLNPSSLKKGVNLIKAVVDFTENFSGLEIMYLIGNFGTSVRRTDRVGLTALPATLEIGDWCGQGLTFYAGHVGYVSKVRPKFEKGQRVLVRVGEYYGVAARVIVDGKCVGITACDPNEVDITDAVVSGKTSELTIEILGSRRNSHGALHYSEQWPAWHGPNTFEVCPGWKDSYNLVPAGLVTSPSVLVVS